jgi:hypothetical protein
MKVLASENSQFSTEDIEGMLKGSGLVELNQKDI